MTAAHLPALVKPRLRGWLHAGMAPGVMASGIVLMALAGSTVARASAGVYTGCGVLLFTTSGLYHRLRWSPRAERWLKRLDHGNVYLLIAGTYTPIAALGLSGNLRTALLVAVWSGAGLGIAFRWLWPDAPRALYTVLYIVLGWSVAPVYGRLIREAGLSVAVLTLVGGVLYTLGAVVYATKRPDPSPRWFGFHEVFHTFTLAAWVCQYIAVSALVYR